MAFPEGASLLRRCYYACHMSTGQRYLRAPEVARACGVSRSTIQRWVVAGTLPAIETPRGRLRVRVEDFKKFLKDST